jgi:hypothetical protein
MSYVSVEKATKNTLELRGRAREVSLVERKGQEKIYISVCLYI